MSQNYGPIYLISTNKNSLLWNIKSNSILKEEYTLPDQIYSRVRKLFKLGKYTNVILVDAKGHFINVNITFD